MPVADRHRLGPLELALGLAIGIDDAVPLLPAPPPGASVPAPREAMRDVVRRALERSPCVLSFSGGRDSSALLSVATTVAREEGLPLPVPVTLRFQDSAESAEDEWQELVVAHLGLTDWERIEVTDQLDAVGPVAQEVLRRHGLLWPFNTHLHQPIVERAAGGSLVTGFGGDELFGLHSTKRAERVLLAGRPRSIRDAAVIAYAKAPRWVRFAHLWRKGTLRRPWLTDACTRRLDRTVAWSDSEDVLGFDRQVRDWWWRCRWRAVCVASFEALGRDDDVQVFHPFAEHDVLAAMAHAGGYAGFGDRTAAMRQLFDDVLPDEVLARPTKGRVHRPLFRVHTREFASRWTGAGVDPELVSVEELRRQWASELPDVLTAPLLQAAWLADHGAGGGAQPSS